MTTSSSNGLTLVELLGVLALVSLISIVVISYLLNGVGQFKRVNKEISLHDEANVIMTQFEKQIFVAKDIEELSQTASVSLIKVTNLENEEIILGFKDNKAVINQGTIHDSKLKILDGSTIRLSDQATVKEGKVQIKMTIKDEQAKHGAEITLENEISYIKSDEG